MNYTIEDLSLNNAEEYARVNVLAWEQSYKGIVDDEYIRFINTEEEIKKLTEKLKSKLGNDRNISFLLRVDGKPVGILSVRESKYDKYPNCGELGAIYLLDEVKGKGFGKILFQKTIEVLKKWGYKKMINGCFEGNPSNEFYKHMGGKLVETKPLKLPNGQVINENFYYYDNI